MNLLPIDKAAVMLGVGTEYVHRLLKSGVLRGEIFRNKWHANELDIIKYRIRHPDIKRGKGVISKKQQRFDMSNWQFPATMVKDPSGDFLVPRIFRDKRSWADTMAMGFWPVGSVWRFGDDDQLYAIGAEGSIEPC